MKTIIQSVLVVLLVCGAASVLAKDYYVAQDGQTPMLPYTNGWTSAASNIQDAVIQVPSGSLGPHTVWVRPGHYTMSTNVTTYNDEGSVVTTNVVFISTRDIRLRATSTNPADTIIDGGGLYRGIKIIIGTTLTPAYTVVVDGFTISNCYAKSYGGGGVYVDGNSKTWTCMVQNCAIVYNASAAGVSGGGGLYNYEIGASAACALTVSNCVIASNNAFGTGTGSGGAGLKFQSASLVLPRPRVIGCRIEGNTASGDFGGGVFANWANLENCIIRNNYVSGKGGGIHNENAYVSLTNTLICNNTANGGGGAVYFRNANELTGYELELVNCTLAGNIALGSYSGGITLLNSNICQASIVNSIKGVSM